MAIYAINVSDTVRLDRVAEWSTGTVALDVLNLVWCQMFSGGEPAIRILDRLPIQPLLRGPVRSGQRRRLTVLVYRLTAVDGFYLWFLVIRIRH